MRLTQHTDYALRVLVFLAVRTEDRVRIQDIAVAYDISHHHLTKVVQQLQHRGFVETVRGKGGGITLARSPALINIGSLVRQIESAEHLVECFSPNNQCAITGTCGLPSIFNEAVEAFMAVLDKYTLEEIVCGRLSALRQVLNLE